MTQPTQSDVHVSAALTDISVAWLQDENGFVSDKVFPVIPVDKQSDFYYEFSKADFMRDEMKPRAESTESAGSGFRLSTTAYSCFVEALHKDVDDRVRANADSVLSLDSSVAEFLAQKAMIRKDRKFATSYFTTGVWGTDITGVNSGPSAGQTVRWDQSASDPAADVDAGKDAVRIATGQIPNTLVIGYSVFKSLRRNASVRDQFKYTTADSITEEMLARFFDIDRLIVAKAVYNTAIEGAAHSGAAIFGKNALLAYVPPSPGLMTPAAGYSFAWRGYTGAVDGVRVSKMRIEQIKSDRLEIEMARDMKVISTDLGYFFSSIVA